MLISQGTTFGLSVLLSAVLCDHWLGGSLLKLLSIRLLHGLHHGVTAQNRISTTCLSTHSSLIGRCAAGLQSSAQNYSTPSSVVRTTEDLRDSRIISHQCTYAASSRLRPYRLRSIPVKMNTAVRATGLDKPAHRLVAPKARSYNNWLANIDHSTTTSNTTNRKRERTLRCSLCQISIDKSLLNSAVALIHLHSFYTTADYCSGLVSHFIFIVFLTPHTDACGTVYVLP